MKISACVHHPGFDMPARSRPDHSVVRVAVNRELKSGKLDFVDLPPEEAVSLATDLLVAARQAQR